MQWRHLSLVWPSQAEQTVLDLGPPTATALLQ